MLMETADIPKPLRISSTKNALWYETQRKEA
jgi:hypothetical protein